MRRTLLLTIVLALVAAPTATAAVPHTVAPGETLWSIAAANGFTTASLAAYNGLAPDANVVLGSTVMIPTEAEALAGGTGGSSSPTAATGTTAPPPAGSYTVRPGDTFSSLAARSGVLPEQVAGVNGLDVDAPLIAGTALKLPPTSAAARSEQPSPARVPDATPTPTATTVTSDHVHGVAEHHGVPGDLAAAIAYQESGFNNAVVSSANARGVMQVMPGTWDWVQRNLATGSLDPASAEDNVHAGTMYLGQLLQETGGDAETAAAGYYQGLSSVRQNGMLPETRRYVANVMALRERFAR